MQKLTCKSVGLRLAGAGLALALVLTSSEALAQPAGDSENPVNRPAATAPPTATPAPPATPAPAATPAATLATGGPKKNGFVFQFQFGGTLYTALGSGVGGGGWMNGGFLFGYKINRLVLGLGLELGYGEHRYKTMSGGGLVDAIDATSLMLFSPTVEYYLAISNPLALYLTLGLNVGFVNVHSDPGRDYTDTALGFHGGLGMRFFLHPRFAIGVEGGLRGVWVLVENDEDTDDDDETYGTMSLYGAVLLTAIW